MCANILLIIREKMGSFNTTCAVSKAPILDGQKVRVFFLLMNTSTFHYHKKIGQFKSSLMGSSCYPWDHFQIVGYPMLATYNDYNRYVFDDSDMENLNLKIINKLYNKNIIAEDKSINDYNSSHDYMNIEKIENMHQLQEMEHSGSLRVKTCHGVSAIAKMAIHEDIYQQLILGKKEGKVSKFQKVVDEKLIEMLEEKSSADKLNESKREVIKKYREKLEEKLGTENDDGEIITKDFIEKEVKFMTRMVSNDYMDFTNEPEKWITVTNGKKSSIKKE